MTQAQIVTLINNTVTNNSNLVNGSTTGSLRSIGSSAESSTYKMGEYALAEGRETMASGKYSHAEGLETTANGFYQHVQGKYNIEDTDSKYAHIVGNGESEENRSNAHTIDWEGNSEYLATTSDISNYAYSKSEIDIALNNYINDIATLIGGEA